MRACGVAMPFAFSNQLPLHCARFGTPMITSIASDRSACATRPRRCAIKARSPLRSDHHHPPPTTMAQQQTVAALLSQLVLQEAPMTAQRSMRLRGGRALADVLPVAERPAARTLHVHTLDEFLAQTLQRALSLSNIRALCR